MTKATSAEQRRLEYVPLDELQPADRNPKRHDLPAIGRSIDTFGYVEPVVVDERTGRLVAGHGRVAQLRAARDGGGSAPDGVTVDEAGGWRVPVLRGWSSVDDTHAEAYLAASNRLVELGGWDDAELGRLLADVSAVDEALLAAAGFDGAELARLLAAGQGTPERLTDPDDAPAVPAVPVSRPGDVWLLGPHRLVCGDSTDPAVLERLMAGGLADCVWTDPPYGMAYGGGRGKGTTPSNRKKFGTRPAFGVIEGDSKRGEPLIALLTDSLSAAIGHRRDAAAVYVCLTWRTWGEFAAAFDANELPVTACIVWDKASLGLGYSHYRPQHEFMWYSTGAWYGDKAQKDVWIIGRDSHSTYQHPTQKPVELITRALENSTLPGHTVLDPFGGSGSTLIACHTTQRVGRLVELDPAYVDVICHRYQAHTGTLPILEATGEPHDFTATI